MSNLKDNVRVTWQDIKQELFQLQDLEYKNFQSRLIPSIRKDTIVGVRTPDLRRLAKILAKDDKIELFLNQLPHRYFEENQLQIFIISEIKDFEICMAEVERFLPFIDNWATCDQLSPKIFRKHRAELLARIHVWLKSDQTYIVRFGVGMLMEHFLEDDFETNFLKIVAAVKSEEYYVKMMVAWYFATALAKQYDEALPFLKEKKLETWIHNRTIQKAIESKRISNERKDFLRKLKR